MMQHSTPQTFGAGFAIPGVNMDLRKPFEVTRLNGKMKKTAYGIETRGSGKFRKDGTEIMRNKVVAKEVIEDAGYLVRFPNGHSIRVADDAELQRLGFDSDPGLVDMLSGEVFMPNMKQIAGQVEMLQYISPDFIANEAPVAQAGSTTVNLTASGSPKESRSEIAKRAAATRKANAQTKGGQK